MANMSPARRREIKDIAWHNAAVIVANLYGGGHFLNDRDGFEEANAEEEAVFERELQRIADAIESHGNRLAQQRQRRKRSTK